MQACCARFTKRASRSTSMSGRGIGVVCALFAAIDAGGKTWEDGGVWRRKPPPRIYEWRPPLQWAGALVAAAVAVLAFPLLVLATALVAYPLSFLVQMVSVDAGFRLATAYADMVRYAFAAAALPTVVPRLVTLCFAAAFLVLAVSAVRAADPTSRRESAQPRSRPMVGPRRGRAVERGAGAAPFPHVALASIPRSRDCERAVRARSQPPLHRASAGEPGTTRIPGADYRHTRRRNTR